MAVEFMPIDRDTPYLFPPSVQDYLPEDHLARFVVEIVDQLDLSHLSAVYTGRGSKPFHPAMLVSLLFYGYATGVFSSRKLEKASYDSIAFRYVCANSNPDHDTINSFRQRFLQELAALFVEILVVAEAMGLVKLGTVSLDGTKIKANASKHKALSWDYAKRLEAQLKQEVEELMRLAEEADQGSLPEAMDIPQELQAIAEAKAEIQARSQARFEDQQAAYEDQLAKREARAKKTGKKPRGKPPKPPTAGPRGKDQVSLTDSESRIMPTSGGGFDQAYNAQAGVDVETHLIVEQHVTQHTNDKQQIEPALEAIGDLPAALGKVKKLLADTGYFSEANVKKCVKGGMLPFIPEKRQQHNLALTERFSEDPEAPQNATAVEAMRHRLQTQEGKAVYAKRKATVETVIGIIKEVLGFRQFRLRGLNSVQGEWSLVCIGWNLKRMHALSP